jgi:hypothetical protein
LTDLPSPPPVFAAPSFDWLCSDGFDAADDDDDLPDDEPESSSGDDEDLP